MIISKTSLSGEEMRWSAISSDIDWDLYDERMSLSLYKSMIAKIKSNTPPPDQFRDMVTSDYWQGGMPYLSIAHYSDANGKAVPGQVLELFVDGKQLKSKGILFDNKLGQAVWKSLKQDEINNKNLIDEDRIRISIAFLDLAHQHGEGGKVFERKSLSHVCQECLEGKGKKIYLDGYLVHLALTRVPVNPRTIMEIEDVMASKSKPKTRKEDAESVLGDPALAEEISKTALESKSDVLVEMSETDETPNVVTEDTQPQIETPVLVEEANTNKKEAMGEEEEDEEKDVKEKKDKTYKSLSDEDVLRIAETVKSMITPSTSIETPDPVTPKSPLDVSYENLYNVIESVKNASMSYEEKLQTIQPVLEELGGAIVEVVKSATPAPTQNPTTELSQVLAELKSVNSKVDSVVTEVATIKAQQLTPTLLEENRIPVPRSIVKNSQALEQKSTEVNPNSVRNISRRSVGLSPVSE